MRRVETVAEIGSDRRDTVQHVEESAPGEFLAWEGNLLVYTGPVPPDTSFVEQTREERHREVLHGPTDDDLHLRLLR